MIVIVAGSRSIEDYRTVCRAITESGFAITLLVSGGAQGVDSLGEKWALDNRVPIKRFPADWKRYGRRAGFVRNALMSEFACSHAEQHGGAGLVAVWDGTSRGTEMMIDLARKAGIQVSVYDARERQGSIFKNRRPIAPWARK
jgi:hypothetical protein